MLDNIIGTENIDVGYKSVFSLYRASVLFKGKRILFNLLDVPLSPSLILWFTSPFLDCFTS